MILVDTSVLIDVLKGVENEYTASFEYIVERSFPFGITSIVYQELLQGAKTEAEYRQLKRYLDTQRFFHPKDPIDSFSSAARIYMDCRKRGVTIRSTVDCLIAQICIEHDLWLFHNDRDFDAMKGVVPLKCYESPF